jgi:ADP-ribose pyrophosphatase YjhB (NUDIX family)
MTPYVLALVVKDEKYLLIQESKAPFQKQWFLPAGGVKRNESLVAAVKRESLEESGLVIEPTALFQIDHFRTDSMGNTEDAIRFAFLCVPTGGSLKKVPDEHSMKAMWVSYSSVRNMELRSRTVIEIIEKHRKGLKLLPMDCYSMKR